MRNPRTLKCKDVSPLLYLYLQKPLNNQKINDDSAVFPTSPCDYCHDLKESP